MTITQVVGFPFWLTYKVLPWVLSPLITPIQWLYLLVSNDPSEGAGCFLSICSMGVFACFLALLGILQTHGLAVLYTYYIASPVLHLLFWALKACWRQWVEVHDKIIKGE